MHALRRSHRLLGQGCLLVQDERHVTSRGGGSAGTSAVNLAEPVANTNLLIHACITLCLLAPAAIDGCTAAVALVIDK